MEAFSVCAVHLCLVASERLAHEWNGRFASTLGRASSLQIRHAWRTGRTRRRVCRLPVRISEFRPDHAMSARLSRRLPPSMSPNFRSVPHLQTAAQIRMNTGWPICSLNPHLMLTFPDYSMSSTLLYLSFKVLNSIQAYSWLYPMTSSFTTALHKYSP